MRASEVKSKTLIESGSLRAYSGKGFRRMDPVLVHVALDGAAGNMD